MKKRDKVFDIYKGVGIMLILFGHGKLPVFIYNFIFSFHLGLFFIGKGFYIKEEVQKYSIPSLIKKYVFKLLFPYIFILCVNCVLLIGKDVYKYKIFMPLADLIQLLEVFTYSNSYTFLKYNYYVYLWFIPIYFISTILLSIIYKYFERKQIFIFIFLALISIIFYSVIDRNKPSQYFWEIDKLPLTVLLGMIGCYIYKKRHLWQNSNFYILLFLSMLTSVFFQYDMRQHIYPHILIFIFYMVGGSVLVLKISQKIMFSRHLLIKRFFILLGQYSYALFLIHCFVFYNLESIFRIIKNPFLNMIFFNFFAISLSILYVFIFSVVNNNYQKNITKQLEKKW